MCRPSTFHFTFTIVPRSPCLMILLSFDVYECQLPVHIDQHYINTHTRPAQSINHWKTVQTFPVSAPRALISLSDTYHVSEFDPTQPHQNLMNVIVQCKGSYRVLPSSGIFLVRIKWRRFISCRMTHMRLRKRTYIYL